MGFTLAAYKTSFCLNSVKTILECGSALKWKLWDPLGKSFTKLFDNSRSSRHLAISDGSILKTLHISEIFFQLQNLEIQILESKRVKIQF